MVGRALPAVGVGRSGPTSGRGCLNPISDLGLCPLRWSFGLYHQFFESGTAEGLEILLGWPVDRAPASGHGSDVHNIRTRRFGDDPHRDPRQLFTHLYIVYLYYKKKSCRSFVKPLHHPRLTFEFLNRDERVTASIIQTDNQSPITIDGDPHAPPRVITIQCLIT